MKKEIREVKTIKGEKILQITTLNERWYAKSVMDEETGLPHYVLYPSVTWIAGYYPKGIAFYKWLANHGWDESEAIKQAAGEKGSKVHQATESVEKGEAVKMNSQFKNPTTDKLEALNSDEYGVVLNFRDWLDKTNPECLAVEQTVFGKFYAGTIDRIYRIGNQIWIVDLKTGQNIWQEHILQVSAYSHAYINYKMLKIGKEEWENRKLAILQIGYRRNKNGYKFTEIPDKYGLFEMAYKVWKNENPKAQPKEAFYPLQIVSKVRIKNNNKKNGDKNSTTLQQS